MGLVVNARPRPLYPGERPSLRYTGGVGSSSVWRGVGSLAHTVASFFTYYANPAHPIHVEYIEIHYLFTLTAMFTVAISTECFFFFYLVLWEMNMGVFGVFWGSLKAESNQLMEWKPNVNALLKILP
jgi:hypothetical protein